MKVLIGVPSFDLLHADFCTSLAGMLMHRAYDRAMSRDVKIAYQNVKSTIIHSARALLVHSAIDGGCTHILFLDSDLTFPPNTLNRLIAHHQPFVCATYVKRHPPHGLLGRPTSPEFVPFPNGLVGMEEVPLGCALIKLTVFDSVPRPHFSYIAGETPATDISEDIGFCRAVRAAGLPIYCDPALSRELGHLTTKAMRLPS